MKEKLLGLTAESKAEQSRKVTEKLLAMSQYKTARSVALYLRSVLDIGLYSHISQIEIENSPLKDKIIS